MTRDRTDGGTQYGKRRTLCEMQIASATGRVYVIITDYLRDGILKLLHFSTVSTK